MQWVHKQYFRLVLDEFLKLGESSDGQVPELVFEQVPFNHPLFVMFSSGTTGVPKCMVHSVGVSRSWYMCMLCSIVSLHYFIWPRNSLHPLLNSLYTRTTCTFAFQGTLIKHLEEHVLQGNLTSDDIMLYYTTVSPEIEFETYTDTDASFYSTCTACFFSLQTGWMMWNWFVSALAVGASIVCYDGSPLVPSPNTLWDLVDNIGWAQHNFI